MFRLLGRYVWQHKRVYFWTIVAIVTYNVTLLLPTQIIQGLIDRMSDQALTRDNVMRDVLFLLAAATINYLSANFWHYHLFGSSVTFKFDLQKIAFAKLLSMRTAFYEKFRSGDMLTRFSTDVDGLMEMLGYGLMIVVYAGGMLVFVLPAMFAISWTISLLALIPLVVLGMMVYVIAGKQDLLIEKNRDAVAALNNEVLEVVEGVRVARAYSKKAVQSRTFAQKTKDLRKVADEITKLQSSYTPLSLILIGLSTSLILWLGGKGLAADQMTLGQVMALQLYMVSLIEPMWMLSDFILIYQTGRTSFEKIQELLEADDDMEADGHLLVEEPNTYIFEQYSFAYPKAERQSLTDINWTLKKGQTVGIVGKTGAGKTTLIRQFLRQYPLGTGQFLVDGNSITAYTRASFEQLLGYVPQEHVLFSKSVEDNIRLSQPDASSEAVDQAIATAAFSQDVKQMSAGLATMIGEKGVSISGGQKQRLSIARAFLRQPELLILDDSLSAVDAKTEQDIIDHIQEERTGKTTLIVAHRLSAVHHADWVLVLDDGRIVEEGRPDDLLGQQGWYYQQYQRQQGQEGDEA